MKCPCCKREWIDNCEQAISIELFDECMVCKFIPGKPGSGNGTSYDVDKISEIRMSRNG